MTTKGRFYVYCNTDECSAEHPDSPMQRQQVNEDRGIHYEIHKCLDCLSHVTVYEEKPKAPNK